MKSKCFPVSVLPEDGPTISGVKPQYQVGDDVNVTCSAGPSKPAASLRWYINGHEVRMIIINRLNIWKTYGFT